MISLIVGALVLFNSPSVPDFVRVPVPLIVGTSIATGAIFFVIMIFAVRAQMAPVRMGVESLVGRIGVARSRLSPSGIVQLGGEQWTAELAEGEENLVAGARVKVIAIQGLKLIVRKE